jgi:hypothetical protein
MPPNSRLNVAFDSLSDPGGLGLPWGVDDDTRSHLSATATQTSTGGDHLCCLLLSQCGLNDVSILLQCRRNIFARCFLNVVLMFPECCLDVVSMFPESCLNVS